ncbi:MAG: hypothetical protein WD738_21470 [Pirellulales bacterium]
MPVLGVAATEQIDLSARPAEHDLVGVSIELEAGGHNLVRVDADGKTPAAEQKLQMSVSARLKYEELRLAPSASDAKNNRPVLAVRYYDKAEAVLKVDETGRSPRLAEDRRLIAVESDHGRTMLYSPDGPLPREQLDLIDVVGNSFFAEQLLPTQPVANGDSWSHDSTVMASFLALDSVAVCEVQSVLDSYNANFAKVRLAGVVHGMSDGAATELEVRALYLFDRRLRRVTRLNLAIREKRSIGEATPGLDAVAKLQIKVEPLKSSTRLTADVSTKVATSGRTPNHDVVYEAAPLGFRFRHDRQWFVTGEQRESVTLRRVDRGDLVAQCTLTALPPKSAGRQVTLDQFEKDVTYSLGKSFGELVSSRQWQNTAGNYCYELVARGHVEEVPVEWHYYLVAPESGHRVSIAVTIEKPMVERLANIDRELVESVELFPKMPATQTAARAKAKDTAVK